MAVAVAGVVEVAVVVAVDRVEERAVERVVERAVDSEANFSEAGEVREVEEEEGRVRPRSI